MAEITAVFIAREWIPKLVNKLVRISDERRAKLDQISLDFPSPEELARFYVEPNCQRVNPANLVDGHVDEYQKPVFKIIDRFLKAPSLDGGGANHRIVLGDAGMGKSSLLVMLWKLHLFGFWPNDVECTLLKLGPDTLGKIAEIAVPSRHILLLDALDEDPSFSAETGGAKARLVELITASMGFRKVIISCRTQFFVDEDNDPAFAKLGTVRLEGFICPISYLSPFDDSQAEELLEKRFPHTWRRYFFRPNKPREKAMSIAKAMGSLTMRPLLLSYIPFLLGDDPNEESPFDLDAVDLEYEIYRLMITRWLDREVLKIKKRGAAAIVPRSEDLRQVCWQVATLMNLDGVRKMPRAAFEELREGLGAPDFLADNTLEGRALLNKDSTGNFRFAHASIQEFLVVEHLLTRGPYVRGANSKCEIEVNDLMQRFYEQRFRANLRPQIWASKSLSHSTFGAWVTRATFAPSSLLILAEGIVKLVSRNAPGDSVAVYLGGRHWADDVTKTVVAAILVATGELYNSRHLLDKLDQLYKLYKLDQLDQLDQLDWLDRIAELSKLLKLSKLSNLDQLDQYSQLYMWAQSAQLAQLAQLDKLDHLYTWDQLDNLHVSPTAVANLATQLAAGLLNLSIPEVHLAEICLDELSAAWPVN